MSAVDTKVTISGSRILHGLGVDYEKLPQDLQKALRTAMNETLSRTRSAGVRRMQSTYALLKAGKQKAGAFIQRSGVRKGDILLTGSVIFRGNVGLPLSYFTHWPRGLPSYRGINPRQRRPRGGIVVQIKKKGHRESIPGSFLIPPRAKSVRGAGLEAELVRRRPGEKYRRNAHFERPMGPSPIQALLSREGEKYIRDYAEETFAKRAAHQLERALGK